MKSKHYRNISIEKAKLDLNLFLNEKRPKKRNEPKIIISKNNNIFEKEDDLIFFENGRRLNKNNATKNN